MNSEQTEQAPAKTGRNHQRRLRAILFADVVGYSRMMSQDEVGTSVRVGNLIRKFEKLGKSFNGELAQTRGDGLFFLFDSVIDAVQLATEIQKLADKDNSELDDPDDHIQFRVGIHLGDVMWVSNQYVGDSVNVAARIESHAGQAGGVCISSAVYEQVKHKLSLGFEYLGPLAFKNIPDPVEVYRVSLSTDNVMLAPSLRPAKHAVSERVIAPLSEKPTVAVLPFEAIDTSEGHDFFADGVTEDLITNLSRFHALSVISRSSTFIYKRREVPLKQVGAELGARYVVTGSIRHAGKRLRITVELADCETGLPVWRERYNRVIDDIFDLQDEITDIISSAIAIQTQSAEKSSRRIQVPALIETYALVLQGQQKLFKYNREQNRQARKMYEAALESESDYSRAMAALSRTHNLDWRYSWTEKPELALEKAFELAQESVILDPSDARGYGELGFVNLYRKEHDASLSSFETALQLNPNDTDIMSNMADALAHSGKSEKAIELLRRALTLNPFYPDQYLWYLGGAYFNLKRYQDVVDTVNRMHSPTEGRRLLAASYAYLGDMEKARFEASKVLEAFPNFSLDHWIKVLPDKDSEETEHFVEGLRRAGLK